MVSRTCASCLLAQIPIASGGIVRPTLSFSVGIGDGLGFWGAEEGTSAGGVSAAGCSGTGGVGLGRGSGTGKRRVFPSRPTRSCGELDESSS